MIKLIVDFYSTSVEDIEEEFKNAVDDYLIFCMEIGKEPDKEYKGLFNVRIRPDLHRAIALKASKDGDTLNAAVEKAIEKYVDKSDKKRNTNEKSKAISRLHL